MLKRNIALGTLAIACIGLVSSLYSVNTENSQTANTQIANTQIANTQVVNAQIENIAQTIDGSAYIPEADQQLDFNITYIGRHYGGKELNHDDLKSTINTVLTPFELIKDKELIAQLVYETAIVETRVGKIGYNYAAKNYRNYGLVQVRTDTAEDLHTFLKKYYPSDFITLMNYRDPNLSEMDNLMYNVPYSVAVCALYYLRRDRDIEAKISTVENRARKWKKYYNTPKGLGTPEIYVKRVNEYLI